MHEEDGDLCCVEWGAGQVEDDGHVLHLPLPRGPGEHRLSEPRQRIFNRAEVDTYVGR